MNKMISQQIHHFFKDLIKYTHKINLLNLIHTNDKLLALKINLAQDKPETQTE